MAKQKRDAEATKARILKNAIKLFAKKGYDGTNVDEIADKSGVNKALLYYYFKNKSNLYSTIMNELLENIYHDISQKNKTCQNICEEMEAFIKTYAKYAFTHPYFPAILLRELSNSGAHLPDMIFSNLRKLFTLLGDILDRGEKEGRFEKSIPMVIHFMILGSINLFITTKSLRDKAYKLEGIETCSNCDIDEVTEYIYKIIKKGIRK